MNVGYVRVSTKEQNTARQEILMRELNVDKVFIDKCSGVNANRPALKEMMSFVREGDTVIVESFSRLARSTTDLLKMVQQFEEKGVKFVSQKESVDTSTPQGRFVLTVFAGLYELEREMTAQRRDEGLAAAKEAGVKFGRPKKEVDNSKFEKVYKEWTSEGITAVAAAEKLGLTMSTFYRRVREFEKEKGLKRVVKVEEI